MLAHQGPRGVAERHARMHGMSCEHTARQRPLAGWAEQPCQLLQIDRHALLIAIGTRRADGENPQRLRSAIECRDQVPIDLVRREALCFVRAEAPVCDEYGAITDGRVRDQIGIDAHGDMQADVLGVGQHEVAQIDAIDRCGGDRLWLLLERRVSQNVVRSVEDGVLRVRENPLAAGTEKPCSHRAHLLTPA